MIRSTQSFSHNNPVSSPDDSIIFKEKIFSVFFLCNSMMHLLDFYDTFTQFYDMNTSSNNLFKQINNWNAAIWGILLFIQAVAHISSYMISNDLDFKKVKVPFDHLHHLTILPAFTWNIQYSQLFLRFSPLLCWSKQKWLRFCLFFNSYLAVILPIVSHFQKDSLSNRC